MEPPSYEEANLHPPTSVTHILPTPPPPSYDVSLSSPQTPPPSYGEAVTTQPDPLPLLTLPRAYTAGASPPPHGGLIIHPVTRVTESQPTSAERSLTRLTDRPALIRCPHCRRSVTTEVELTPGNTAWCTCLFLALMGLVCGICLIPLFVPGLKDARHSCPECGKHIHTYLR